MPLLTDSLTIPPASSLNSTGKSAAARQLPAAAERAVVPLVYGEDRISGLILNVLSAAGAPGTLLVQVLWCHACDSVNDVRLNDQALPAGASITHYTGAQTSTDATLAAAFAAQGITGVRPLTGYAWSLLAMPAALFDGQVNVTARIRGRRCYDPAFDSTASGSGPQRLNDPSTWAYTDIPAVCLGDFLASTVYGCGVAVNWDSVRITSAANRVIVPGSSEQRRLVGVSFTSPASASDVAETLRAYAGCYLLPSASGVRLLPDQDDSPVAAYRHADGQIAAIEALELRDLGQAPTAVEVIYTDRSAIPWRDASAIAQLDGAGTTKPWRLSQVRLPGVHRYGQAKREATERLNKLVLNDITTVLEVHDIGIKHEQGDIITVTHPLGLSETAMRVSGPPTMPAPGRWRLPLVRHSAAAYSDIVASAAAIQDAQRIVPGPTSQSRGAALNTNPACNDPSAWTLGGGTQPVFRQGVAGAPGGTCLSNASGAATEVLSDRFAIDPARRYKISILAARLDAGTAGRSYLGIAWYDADGALLNSGVVAPAGWSNGTYSYYGLVNQLPPAVFTAYELVFGPGTSAAIPSSAASARIVALLNLNAQAGAVHAISLARVENIDDAWAAQAAASAAQSTANGAATDASSALSTLATMRSNGYLDAAEKPVVIKAWNSINGEYAGIYNQGTTYGLATLRDAFATAYGNLGTYLNGLSPGWNDTTTDTPITPATDQATWAAYYSARQTLLNAIANETAKRANWDQLSGVTNFRVIAGGGSATSLPASGGLYVQGAAYSGLARSYTVTRIRRSDGAVTYDQAFDVYGTAGADAAMAAALNATDSSYIVVVRSYDEPQANRLTGGLAAAMYRCGASRAVFGSSQFRYRSAYVLVGIAGCGEGNGAEAYQGSVDADPNAWVDMAFQVVAGNLVGVTANFTPLSLQDYGYTGSLDATRNTVTYSASAPGSPADGDIWVDLSTTPARIKLRVGGNWQSGATLTTNTNQLTDGANLGSTAVWNQVSGTGKPADSATKNVLTRSTSAPSSPTDGDLWCDTSLTPNVWKVRLGGTWQPAASYVTNTADIVDGANLGLTAIWTGVTGSGKPADNATRNLTYRQSGDPASSPGGVVDGELWLDTGTGRAWQRVSGAWQPYVGNASVATAQLADQAATVVAVYSDTGATYSNIA